MKENSFSYSFKTSKTPKEVFDLLLDIPQWWFGIYDETIKGESKKVNDEFTFKAGGGMHYSKQKLVELVPGKKIVWQVVDSKLSFLNDTGEWNGSKIEFDLSPVKEGTQVIFTHQGLVPEIECYNNCSSAWTQYLINLKQKLNETVSV